MLHILAAQAQSRIKILEKAGYFCSVWRFLIVYWIPFSCQNCNHPRKTKRRSSSEWNSGIKQLANGPDHVHHMKVSGNRKNLTASTPNVWGNVWLYPRKDHPQKCEHRCRPGITHCDSWGEWGGQIYAVSSILKPPDCVMLNSGLGQQDQSSHWRTQPTVRVREPEWTAAHVSEFHFNY